MALTEQQIENLMLGSDFLSNEKHPISSPIGNTQVVPISALGVSHLSIQVNERSSMRNTQGGPAGFVSLGAIAPSQKKEAEGSEHTNEKHPRPAGPPPMLRAAWLQLWFNHTDPDRKWHGKSEYTAKVERTSKLDDDTVKARAKNKQRYINFTNRKQLNRTARNAGIGGKDKDGNRVIGLHSQWFEQLDTTLKRMEQEAKSDGRRIPIAGFLEFTPREWSKKKGRFRSAKTIRDDQSAGILQFNSDGVPDRITMINGRFEYTVRLECTIDPNDQIGARHFAGEWFHDR